MLYSSKYGKNMKGRVTVRWEVMVSTSSYDLNLMNSNKIQPHYPPLLEFTQISHKNRLGIDLSITRITFQSKTK